jgi:hypothetical protein
MYSCVLIWCISACDVLRIHLDRKIVSSSFIESCFLLTGYFGWWFIADLLLCGRQGNQSDLRSQERNSLWDFPAVDFIL